MGLGCPKTVTSWVGRGWLRPIGGRRARPWRFAATALWDLVALPEAVVAIQPERITDAELRAYAVEQRAQHPRWLRLTEVARRYHVTSGTVAGWVAQGRFAAEHVQRYGVLWLREDALHGFVAPCEQRWVRTACCRRRVPIGREHAANGGADLSDLLAQRARAARRPPAAPRAAGSGRPTGSGGRDRRSRAEGRVSRAITFLVSGHLDQVRRRWAGRSWAPIGVLTSPAVGIDLAQGGRAGLPVGRRQRLFRPV